MPKSFTKSFDAVRVLPTGGWPSLPGTCFNGRHRRQRHRWPAASRATGAARDAVGLDLRAEGFAEGDLYSPIGDKFPFADTKAERLTKGDPRLSVEERYAGNDDYVAKLRQVCDAMIADRLLLPRDADCIVAAAEVGENVLTAA